MPRSHTRIQFPAAVSGEFSLETKLPKLSASVRTLTELPVYTSACAPSFDSQSLCALDHCTNALALAQGFAQKTDLFLTFSLFLSFSLSLFLSLSLLLSCSLVFLLSCSLALLLSFSLSLFLSFSLSLFLSFSPPLFLDPSLPLSLFLPFSCSQASRRRSAACASTVTRECLHRGA